MKRLLLGLLSIAILSGCSTVNSRIKEKPSAFAALSTSDQALVRKGGVREGFSPEAVYLAWGKADSVREGSRHGRAYQTWIYLAAESVPDRGFIYPASYYYGYGGYSGYGGRYRSAPYLWYDDFDQTRLVPYRTATFERNRLAAWSDEAR